jgi:anti-sigma regulatory factor (Ser/Thr protein kinase)
MKRRTDEIRRFILQQVDDVGRVRVNETASKFGVTRQAIFKNFRSLIVTSLIEPTQSKERPYKLRPLRDSWTSVEIGPDTQENKIWTESVAPLIRDLKSNVVAICQYGFTEMFNNVIDHSQSGSADIWVTVDALVVRIAIQDHGIGIWKKLQQECRLDDPRHALLELTKGKLTTDPKRHTGEGIFFTSRMFDKFLLSSDSLTFCRFQEGDEWLFDIKEHETRPGTRVTLVLYVGSDKTAKEVFDKFTADLDDFGFTRTHLSVQLVKYEGDHLVSRSQAKRLLSRLDKFKEVYLDFRDVADIGQAFADEIFRVFQDEHPSIRLIPINTKPEVERMIRRTLAHEGQTELPM